MKTIFFAIAIIAVSYSVNAQTTTKSVNQTITLNLQDQIDISIVSEAGKTFNFQSVADYTDGLTNSSAATFNVKSNKPWNVTVNASTATFNGGSNDMPASVLAVRLAGGETFSSLSTTAASLKTGGRGSSNFTVDYKATPGFDFDAGNYTIEVVYTATQQ